MNDMDEDERLLASEEGKQLSSKERRRLRNKISARAFRLRRKEYISQLEKIDHQAQLVNSLLAQHSTQGYISAYSIAEPWYPLQPPAVLQDQWKFTSLKDSMLDEHDTEDNARTPRWPSKKLSLTNPWSKKGSPQDIIRSYLPLEIQGQVEAAVADTGSHENVISETLVRKLKLSVHKTETESHQFVNAIGKSMSAIGYTNVRCHFEDGSKAGTESKFWVFPKLKIPLVVGRRFLELTGTLTSFRHRLRDIIAPKGVSLRVLHMELPRWRLNCRIGEEVVLANPDTGSDLDLMSRLFVERSGFQIHKLMSENQYVEFADGERIRLSGVVYVPFTIGLQSKEETLREFYILDGLTSDVLLGNKTLIEIDVFNTCRDDLVDIEEYDHFCDFHFIRWAQKTESSDFLDAAFSDFDFSYHNTGFASDPSTPARTSFSSKLQFLRSRRRRSQQGNIMTVAESRTRSEQYLQYKDINEDRRRKREAKRITKLPTHERSSADGAETVLKNQYDRDRANFVAKHAAAVALALRSSTSQK